MLSFDTFNLYALTMVYMRCVFALRTKDSFTNCDLTFSFRIVKHDCWSVSIVLNLWDAIGTSWLLWNWAWVCVVMYVCHLITTQLSVIRWIPYKENVPFVNSSRWRVCVYCSHMQAIACPASFQQIYLMCNRNYSSVNCTPVWICNTIVFYTK